MSKKSDSWLQLIHAVAGIENELGKMLQTRHGLGLSEYRALDILARSPGSEQRIKDLATHLRLNQSSVSRMVERLQRNALAFRDLCPDDKRGVYAVLTDTGRARLEQARKDYDKALSSALKSHNFQDLLPA